MAVETPASELERLLGGEREPRRYALWAGAAALLVVAAVGAYLLTSGGGSAVAVEPEPATATLGEITSTTTLSGTAAAARDVELTFGTAGVVASIEVAVGDEVAAGDVLATLDDRDALRAVETAEVNVELARLRLDELTGDPASAEVASALASVAAADVQVTSAEQALEGLRGGATAADVSSSQQALASAYSQLAAAEDAVAALQAGPTAAQLAQAQAALAQAQSQLANATFDLTSAEDEVQYWQDRFCLAAGNPSGYCGTGALPLSPALIRDLQADLDAEQPDVYLTNGSGFLDASIAYNAAIAAERSATAAVEEADDALAGLEIGGDGSDLFNAKQSLAGAQANYEAARERYEEVTGGPATSEIAAAQASLDSARASLASAQERYAELVGGADAVELLAQQQSVRQAEIALEAANEALDDLRIVAPFDGTVVAIDVELGESVAANAVAVQLTTPNDMRINFTVSEAEVFDLEPGQVGLATFDSIEDATYPVRILSVGTRPTVAQGVVTYAVEAEILVGGELADVSEELQALAGGGGGALLDRAGALGAGATLPDGATVPGGGQGGAGGFGGQGGAGGLGQALAEVELPEGVTLRDVTQALLAGEPLPDGVVLPEGFELPEGFALPEGAGGGAAGEVAEQFTNQRMPLAGMSASVEILLEVRDGVLLIPATAVRTQGSSSYVVVMNEGGEFERLTVVVGDSDGTTVEVVSGLSEGDTVYINASAPATDEFTIPVTEATSGANGEQGFGPPGGFQGGNFGGAGGGGAGGAGTAP